MNGNDLLFPPVRTVFSVSVTFTMTLEDGTIRTLNSDEGNMHLLNEREGLLTFTYKESGDIEWFRGVRTMTIERTNSDGYVSDQNFWFQRQ